MQLFSDKSQISLSSRLLSIYLFHVTTLNYNKQVRKALFTSGGSIFSYFPINSSLGGAQTPHLMVKMFGRIDMLQAIYDSIRTTLETSYTISLKIFSMKMSDGLRLIQHPVLASYVVDFLKKESMPSFREIVLSASSCNKGVIPKQYFSFCQIVPRRTLDRSLIILQYLKDWTRLSAPQDLEKLFMLTLGPLLSSVPFTNVPSSLEAYNIFNVEPVH